MSIGSERWCLRCSDAESQSSQGKTLLEHCADIAAALFIENKPDTKWTRDDIKDLRVVVKNRIMR